MSIKAVILLIFAFLALGCATYPYKNRKAIDFIYTGQFNEAAKLLDKGAKEDSKDQVLFLFDRGMALHLAGRYKESEQDWIKADKLTEIKDYTSISTEAATLLTNDTIKQYKGEDFEKVLINAFLAINYLMEGNFEDALVETRRVNQKLYFYKTEAKRDYEQNPFARYLAAMIWEASGKVEDAYIDYKEAATLIPDFPYLKYDLTRLSKRLGRYDDLKIWEKKYGQIQVPLPKEEKVKGEIIFIYQQGKSAVKRPNSNAPRFPKFHHRSSEIQRARVEIVDQNQTELTEKIYSVSEVAIKTLDDAYAGLITKKVGGLVAKAIVADQVRQKNEILGILTWVGLNAADQADLRHWESLPETLQIARLQVASGNHTIKLIGLNASGQPTPEEKIVQVTVKAGGKVFLNWRTFN